MERYDPHLGHFKDDGLSSIVFFLLLLKFNLMYNYLELVRYKNLLFLAFTQLLMQQLIVSPLLQKYGFDYLGADFSLLLLITATVFIAAAGYVINDYFDIKIDRINKPEKLFVGTLISKKQAMLLHNILTGIGVLCGLFLAFRLHSFTLGFLFVVVPGLLWFYSASYKRQFLTGNLIVALLAGLSVLIVGIYNVAGLKNAYNDLVFQTTIPAEIYSWIGGFAAFSFFLTFIRELVKDMQDVEGDKEMECRTVAIVWGFGKTKILIYTLVLITIILLIATSILLIPFEGLLSIKYLLFGVVIPLIVFCYLIYKAQLPETFHSASTFLKYIMLTGVLYSILFYFLLAKSYSLSLFNLFMIK